MSAPPEDNDSCCWLDSKAVELLLPHRPPMLMVDCVHLFASGGVPRLEAGRSFEAAEPFFAGHFPGLPMVPGVLIVEGLAQSAGLLRGLLALEQHLEKRNLAATSLRDHIAEICGNETLGCKPTSSILHEAIDARRRSGIGVLASSRIRFRHPVFPSETLRYAVALRRQLEQLTHFEVRASLADRLVADGSLVLGWRPHTAQAPAEH